MCYLFYATFTGFLRSYIIENHYDHEKKKKFESVEPATLLVLLTILSCDSFKEDFIEPAKQVIFSTTDYYVLPGSSVVIDLESLVEQSFANASLKISQNPIRGSLSQLGTLL